MSRHDEIVTFVREALGLGEGAPLDLSPLARRGSDRAFFRLTFQTGSVILIDYETARVENAYYADIAVFLHHIGVSVPALIRHDPVRRLVLTEDLGDEDLWSFRGEPWDARQPLYESTIATIERLHSFPEKDFHSSSLMLTEPFGSELYRWERDYFRHHFVRDVCRIDTSPAVGGGLEEELSSLAERLAQGPHSLLHRDLQSQNVMVRDGQVFLIDFQGMRFGNPLYDLGSLLCDPYMELTEGERDHLVAFYHGLSPGGLEWPAFRRCFWEAAAQRLMQALGAYGFLGLTKGLDTFLQHIPAGLRNLQFAASQAGSLPLLSGLLERCSAIIEEEGSLRKTGGPRSPV